MNSQNRLSLIAKEFINPEEWPTLRGVEGSWNEQTLKINFYFGEKIDDILQEEASVLATEILAQYADGYLEENYIYLPNSVSLPDSSFWIYTNSG